MRFGFLTALAIGGLLVSTHVAANGLFEDRPWQFPTPWETDAKTNRLLLQEQKRGGFFDDDIGGTGAATGSSGAVSGNGGFTCGNCTWIEVEGENNTIDTDQDNLDSIQQSGDGENSTDSASSSE